MTTKMPNFVPVNVKTLKTYGYTKKVETDVFNNIAKNFKRIISPENKDGNVYLKQQDILQELNTRHQLDTVEGAKVLKTLSTGKTPLIQILHNRELNTQVVIPTKYFWQK